ncbi:MAG: threonine synthase [Candidatus Aenigmarchaeota archaeon]|nr:threonine synthase [Candidatus Aenigmarchaeota archaeon]
MLEKNIICSNCGRKYPLNKIIFRCEKCKGSLEVLFDYSQLRKLVSKDIFRSRPFNHARYKEMYPVKNILSISEGGTPLIRSKNIEKKQKLNFELYFKYEAVNPTGSFKDRGSSVEVSKAVEFGAKRVVCASTGNMGASVAAYSGIANIPCYIFTPHDALHTKLEQIMAYGAKLYKVSGDYTKTFRLVEEAYNMHEAHLLGDYLYRREGTKSVGYEIIDQLDFELNDTYVFTPIGNGTLISAMWKAFKEFYLMGMTYKKPKMAGIQADRCNPVTVAFRDREFIKPQKRANTIAKAIECGDPMDGDRALQAINESNGFSESVTDNKILRCREMLAEEEGLFAEPAGAVSLAGLLKSKDQIEKYSRVVCVITGHGLKTPNTGVSRKEIKIKPDKSLLPKIFS